MRILFFISVLTFIWNSSISQGLNQGQLFASPSEKTIDVRYNTSLNQSLAQVDEFVFRTITDRFSTFKNLAIYLTQSFNNEQSKVRSIYTWIALNIEYDQKSIISSLKNNQTAIEVWKTRSAVCEGYANLFKEMCSAAGIESRIIKGYVKNFASDDLRYPNHAWNSVKINGKWRLLDVTWASVNNEASRLADPGLKKNLIRQKLDIFFLVQPTQMILTHLPEDPYWQLQNNYINMETFQKGEEHIQALMLKPNKDMNDFEVLISRYEGLDSLDKSIAYLERMERNKSNKSREYGLGIAYYYKAQKILKEATSNSKKEAVNEAKIYYQKSLNQLAILEKEDFGYEFSKDLVNNVAFRIESLQ